MSIESQIPELTPHEEIVGRSHVDPADIAAYNKAVEVAGKAPTGEPEAAGQSEAMQDALRKAREMGERAAQKPALFPDARSRQQADIDLSTAQARLSWEQRRRSYGRGPGR